MAFSFSIGIESKSHCIQNFEGCLFIDFHLTISEKLLDSITAHILLIYGNKPQIYSFPASMVSVSTDVSSCFQTKFYNLTTAAGDKEQLTKWVQGKSTCVSHCKIKFVNLVKNYIIGLGVLCRFLTSLHLKASVYNQQYFHKQWMGEYPFLL